MDIEGLRTLVRRFEHGAVRLHFVDTVEPSVLAHEILNGAPFTYLDEDTEIGERRSRAVPLRRRLPVEPRELGHLDPDAIQRVRAEAAPAVQDAEELHDLLLSLVAARPRDEWRAHFETLARSRRCFEVRVRGAHRVLWGPTERRGELELLFPDARFVPDHGLAPGRVRPPHDEPAVDVIQGHLEISGPVTVQELVRATGLTPSPVTIALETPRTRGFAVAGRFESAAREQWCARRLLARIHSYTRERRRAAIRPISQEEWSAFLQSWWHVTPGTQLHGRAGLAQVIEQLHGSEWPAGELERLLAQRVASYRPEWLDELCLSGEAARGRLALLEPNGEDQDPRPDDEGWTGKISSRQTPITLMLRHDLPWLLQAPRGGAVPAQPSVGPGADVLDALRARGALFHGDLQSITGRSPAEVEEGLWDGVARGLVSADRYTAMRSLLQSRTRGGRRARPSPSRYGSRGRRGGWRQAAERR